jgi:hypothetical protein
MRGHPSQGVNTKSYNRIYWTSWSLCVSLLMAVRLTIFRSASENSRFALFCAYAALTWMPMIICHVYENKRLLKYLRARFPDHRALLFPSLWRVKSCLSAEDLEDPTTRFLIQNYQRVVLLLWIEFITIPVWFLAVMLDLSTFRRLLSLIA